MKDMVGQTWELCCCTVTGNAISLLTAAILFAAITATQWIFASIANSDALKADCVSMGVDVLAFLGNLFAECNPFPDSKRKLELTMSGISHFLLLGFTISFILEGIDDVTSDDDGGDEVNGYIVLGFALGGLAFDLICLLVYKTFGSKKTQVRGRRVLVFLADASLDAPQHSRSYLPHPPPPGRHRRRSWRWTARTRLRAGSTPTCARRCCTSSPTSRAQPLRSSRRS
jgi:Co/Zn/Cd efflux system component